MKRIYVLFLSVFCAFNAFAQDRVITKEGDVFEAYRIDIGSTYVYYTKEDKDDADLQKIAKADVLMIRKKDGTKINMTEPVAGAKAAPAQTASVEGQSASGIIQLKPEDLSAEARAANEALIAKVNAPVELVCSDKHKEDVGKKKANSGIACFGIAPNSVLCNEDIEVNVEIESLFKKSKNKPAEWKNAVDFCGATVNPAIRFTVKNKSTQTLYLDLANTFFVSMGQSNCYYIPSSTTTSKTSSGGAGVNLGAVTGALGIGGVAGTLANGVNVGGGSSNTTTNTTYSQRIIAVAPMSSVNLEPQYLFGNEKKTITAGLQYRQINSSYSYCGEANFSLKSDAGVMMLGDHYSYTNDSSPVKVSFFLAYSKSENCVSERVLPSYYYLKDLLGSRYISIMCLKGEPNRNDVPHFRMLITNNKGDSFPKK